MVYPALISTYSDLTTGYMGSEPAPPRYFWPVFYGTWRYIVGILVGVLLGTADVVTAMTIDGMAQRGATAW